MFVFILKRGEEARQEKRLYQMFDENKREKMRKDEMKHLSSV